MGDIAHNPGDEFAVHPDWTPIFDYDPAQAIKSRKAILDRVATRRDQGDGLSFSVPMLLDMSSGATRHTTGKLPQWIW